MLLGSDIEGDQPNPRCITQHPLFQTRLLPWGYGFVLRAQYWPLRSARLCCCFGFHRSEASIVHEFYSGGKKRLRIFNLAKMAA